MSEIETELKSALGTIGFCMLMKALRKIEVGFDSEDRTLIIYRDKHEPVVIDFVVIEEFVNNVH